jgi:hypothetical protein
MTEKKIRTSYGKEIRRATGLKLPAAMKAAKILRKGDRETLASRGFATEERLVSRDPWGEDPTDVIVEIQLIGPRGKIYV